MLQECMHSSPIRRNVEQARASRRLKANPRQCLEAAKAGSVYDMEEIMTFGPQKFSASLQPTLFDTFMSFFMADKPPPPPSLAEAERHLRTHNRLVMTSMVGLSDLGKHFSTTYPELHARLFQSWPSILRWMNYLFDYSLVSGDVRGPNAYSFAEGVYQLLNYLKDGSESSNKIFSSLELFELCVRLWEKDPADKPFPKLSYMILWCDFFDGAVFERMEILNTIMGGADAVVKLVLKRIRSTMDFARSPDHDYAPLIVQLKVLNNIFPPLPHPIRTALLRNAAIPLQCSISMEVSSSTVGRLHQRRLVLGECTKFLQLCLLQYSVHCAVQSLRHGILGMVANQGSLLPGLTEHHYNGLINMLSENLLKYLASASLLPVFAEAMYNCKKKNKLAGVSEDQKFHASWVSFEDLLLERLVLRQLQKQSSRQEIIRCSNFHCNRLGRLTEFKRCAGCRVSNYCGKECQKAMWLSGSHKLNCADIAFDVVEGSLLSYNDRRFFNLLAVVGLKRYIENMDDEPDGSNPQEIGGLSVDFSVCPPTLSCLSEQDIDVAIYEEPGHGAELRNMVFERVKAGDRSATLILIDHGKDEMAYCIADLKSSRGVALRDMLSSGSSPSASEDESTSSSSADNIELNTSSEEVDAVVRRVRDEAQRSDQSIWSEDLVAAVVRDYLEEVGIGRETPVIYY